MEYSDQKLISAVQNRDLRAYEDLYKKYYVYLCYVAEHIIRSHADAEEIVSDVFVRLWNLRERTEINSSVKAYLIRAVHNASLNYIEQNAIRLKSTGRLSSSDLKALAWDKENVTIEPVVSWKENRWIFENQSLSQIAIDLECRYDVRIVFESERLKSYRFTGIILAEPIEQVLEVMSITAPINFRLKGNVVTLSENKDFIEVNKDLYVKPKQSNLKTLLPMENTRGI